MAITFINRKMYEMNCLLYNHMSAQLMTLFGQMVDMFLAVSQPWPFKMANGRFGKATLFIWPFQNLAWFQNGSRKD